MRLDPPITSTSDTTAAAGSGTEKEQSEFRVAEKREDGAIILQLDDGRMFKADAGDLDLSVGNRVTLKSVELKDGVPQDAVIAKRVEAK